MTDFKYTCCKCDQTYTGEPYFTDDGVVCICKSCCDHAESGPKNILLEANSIVNGKRQQDYGHPADDFQRTADMWSALLGTKVSAQQVGLCMIAVKLSRECNRHTRDNLVDVAGYAQTVQMIEERKARLAQRITEALGKAHDELSSNGLDGSV